MDAKIYNPIVKINISVFLINMLKVYTISHPASHKDTNHSNHIQMRVKLLTRWSKFQNSIHRVCLLLDTLFFQGFYKFLYLWSNYIDIIIPNNSIKLLALHFVKSYLKSMRNIV